MMHWIPTQIVAGGGGWFIGPRFSQRLTNRGCLTVLFSIIASATVLECSDSKVEPLELEVLAHRLMEIGMRLQAAAFAMTEKIGQPYLPRERMRQEEDQWRCQSSEAIPIHRSTEH